MQANFENCSSLLVTIKTLGAATFGTFWYTGNIFWPLDSDLTIDAIPEEMLNLRLLICLPFDIDFENASEILVHLLMYLLSIAFVNEKKTH